jgi:hypothetical protein
MKKAHMAVGFVAVSSFSHFLQAADFPRGDTHAADSLAQGVGAANLPILQRQSGDPEATVSSLLPVVCQGDCDSVVRETRKFGIRVSGKTWHLDVFGDGSMSEFSDDAARARAHDQGIDASSAMSQAALEAAGRAYISKVLSKVVALQPGDDLVPDVSSARTEGGSDVSGNLAPVKVTGNRIAFTRTINGIPVVGAGSKVTITFLNDGTVESFRYDWPSYVATGRQADMINVGDILQRVQFVMGVRTGAKGAPPPTITVPTNPTASTVVDLGADVQMQRLSCGYYDSGLLTRRAGAPMQAGCYYHVTHVQAVNGLATTAAYSGAVPAAVQAEIDSGWPEEGVLRGVIASGVAIPGTASTPGPGSKPSPGKN